MGRPGVAEGLGLNIHPPFFEFGCLCPVVPGLGSYRLSRVEPRAPYIVPGILVYCAHSYTINCHDYLVQGDDWRSVIPTFRWHDSPGRPHCLALVGVKCYGNKTGGRRAK